LKFQTNVNYIGLHNVSPVTFTNSLIRVPANHCVIVEETIGKRIFESAYPSFAIVDQDLIEGFLDNSVDEVKLNVPFTIEGIDSEVTNSVDPLASELGSTDSESTSEPDAPEGTEDSSDSEESNDDADTDETASETSQEENSEPSEPTPSTTGVTDAPAKGAKVANRRRR